MALSHRLPTDPLSAARLSGSRRPLTFAPPRDDLAAPSPVAPATRRAPRRRERPLVLILVAGIHVAAAIGFARFQPAQPPAPPPITVALIEPPVAIPTPPPPAPPPPQLRPPPRPPKPAPPKVVPKPAPVPPPVTEAPGAIRSEPSPATPPAAPQPAAPPEPPAPVPAPRSEAPPARVHETVAARFDAAYLNNPAPAYPPLARRMREEGKVMLRVFVTADGAPGKIELSASSGSARLDAAAESAVSRWRFVPAKQDGRSVDAWVIVPIVFKLEGS